VVSSFLGDISHFIASYGYVAIVLGILLENFGMPTPGETLLVFGGIAASRGTLDIRILLPLCALAAIVGNQIGFQIGRTGGHHLLVRYGNRVGITHDRLNKVEAFFDRHGEAVLIFARFVVGLRQFSGIVAGMLEMQPARFLLFNMIGAVLWVGFWGMLAFWLGKRVLEFMDELWPLVIAVVALAILAAVAHYFWRRWRARQAGGTPQSRTEP
jgi:membrane protein DedA with SNARE-associated domain